MVSSFPSWFDQRNGNAIRESEKVIPIVAQAGPQGISRGEIGGVIKLDRQVLDDLLAGFVRFGLIAVSRENGVQMFRAANVG